MKRIAPDSNDEARRRRVTGRDAYDHRRPTPLMTPLMPLHSGGAHLDLSTAAALESLKARARMQSGGHTSVADMFSSMTAGQAHMNSTPALQAHLAMMLQRGEFQGSQHGSLSSHSHSNSRSHSHSHSQASILPSTHTAALQSLSSMGGSDSFSSAATQLLAAQASVNSPSRAMGNTPNLPNMKDWGLEQLG
jgi:hypothetical protein